MIITKGHLTFVELLDKELHVMGMDHKYTRSTGYMNPIENHLIELVKEEKKHFLFFHWNREVRKVVARIVAEPHTIVEHGESDTLKIEVFYKEYLSAFDKLASKFMEIFGLEVEIIY